MAKRCQGNFYNPKRQFRVPSRGISRHCDVQVQMLQGNNKAFNLRLEYIFLGRQGASCFSDCIFHLDHRDAP